MKLNDISFLFAQLLFAALLMLSLPLKADQQHFVFAMPFSGDKGSHYDIQLGFRDNEIKKFHIPDDCNSIMNMVNFGYPNPINLIDRKLWFKSINDCKYVMMMHLNEGGLPEKNFVSDYDYFNARLADLPFSSQCKATDDEIFQQECSSIPQEGKVTIRSYFPFLEVLPNDKNIETEECRFTDGLFRGRLVRTDQGIRCQKDRRAKGLRLLSVDYSDLNNDSYMDVLLRIMPLGRGVSRFPILLPLTRFAPDAEFSLCEGVAYDYMMDIR
jgi:hypothetical protein